MLVVEVDDRLIEFYHLTSHRGMKPLSVSTNSNTSCTIAIMPTSFVLREIRWLADTVLKGNEKAITKNDARTHPVAQKEVML
jgi:hypothetical protein